MRFENNNCFCCVSKRTKAVPMDVLKTFVFDDTEYQVDVQVLDDKPKNWSKKHSNIYSTFRLR